MGVMVQGSSRDTSSATFVMPMGFISLIPLYLPAVGKTCIYVLETLKSLAGYSSLQVLGPDRSSQRIPQVHSSGITETCYFPD